MAKRFTDSTKWNSKFLRGLKAPYKILWLYILDECDHAGIWTIDMDVARLKTGEKVNLEDAVIFFGTKIKVVDGDEKMFIPDFIDFQYGELNPANKVHDSVIKILNKYNLLDESLKIKPLPSPLQGAKDKYKDMDKSKSMDKVIDIVEEEKNEKTKIEIAMDEFIAMRTKIKKPATDRAIELIKLELEKLAPNNEQLQIDIINQSILNNYQDVYPLKKKNNEQRINPNNPQTTVKIIV